MSVDTLPLSTSPKTFWEKTADTRWGQYITNFERSALLQAATAFDVPTQALEIGCEGGRWSGMLANLGWEVTATDVDPNALQVCQDRYPSIRCILADPSSTEFPADDQSVDLLLCLEVPPIINQSWYAAEAFRVLKPRGKLIGNLNNLCSWRGVAGRLKSSLLRQRQFYARSYSDLQHSLQQSGFQIDSAVGCCWAPFGRHSDSKLVPLAASLESAFGLTCLPSVSPWVIYVATRST